MTKRDCDESLTTYISQLLTTYIHNDKPPLSDCHSRPYETVLTVAVTVESQSQTTIIHCHISR